MKKKLEVQRNPIDTMIQRVTSANKYPSNGRLETRDRISIERRGWGNYWLVFATTEGGTWSSVGKRKLIEMTDGSKKRDDRANKYVHNTEGVITINCGWHTDPRIRIDPVARTWTLLRTPWQALHKYMWWNGLYPGRDSFRYADRWNKGGYEMTLLGKRYHITEGLTVHYHRNGTIKKVVGGKLVRLYTPSPAAKAYIKDTMARIRKVLGPMESMRAAVASRDHPTFGYAAMNLRNAVGIEARVEAVVAGLRAGKYTYELHQDVLLFSNPWNPSYESAVKRLIKALVIRKFAK